MVATSLGLFTFRFKLIMCNVKEPFSSFALATLKYSVDSKEVGFHEHNVSSDGTSLECGNFLFPSTFTVNQIHLDGVTSIMSPSLRISDAAAWYVRKKVVELHVGSNRVGQSLGIKSTKW